MLNDFAPVCNVTGHFASEWAEWYGRQRLLAGRFEGLQGRAGKLFTIADVDVCAGYMSDPVEAGRQRPSAAEFMAHLTVRVATNMDIAAEARGGARQPMRPDPRDFLGAEADVPGTRGSGGAERDGLSERALALSAISVCSCCGPVGRKQSIRRLPPEFVVVRHVAPSEKRRGARG